GHHQEDDEVLAGLHLERQPHHPDRRPDAALPGAHDGGRRMKLSELASTVRSKNAGVNQITFDIIFPDRKTYERVVKSNAITRDSIARLYNIPQARISDFVTF